MLARESFDGPYMWHKPGPSGESNQTNQTDRTDHMNKTGWLNFSALC
jgi:hypothetical protein